MDLAHVHLLLNHWPILGSLIALALYALALATNSDDLKQVSLAFYALLALLAVPTYISGNAADEVLKKTANWPTDLVHAHQGAAMLGLIFIEITGLAAFIGLWQYSRMSRPFPQSA